jgi:hypothetical protein
VTCSRPLGGVTGACARSASDRNRKGGAHLTQSQLLKKHALLPIDERFKSETQKGLILSFVSGRWIRQVSVSISANSSFA